MAEDLAKAWGTVGHVPEPSPRPVLVMLSGLPGTGKSHLARRLAGRVPLAVVSTDTVRLALVTRPTYTWQESRRVYAACQQMVGELLAKGVPTMFDATNLVGRFRAAVYKIAEEHSARLVVVETVAPENTVRKRMERRSRREDEFDRSEADFSVYLRMKKSAEPIRHEHFTVDTSEGIESAIDQIVEAIRNNT
ncbi:MAG: ATP-binding protein [Chloroflexi bacterium]|nr:ATP-binding protein [Chloroflexota bacterium]